MSNKRSSRGSRRGGAGAEQTTRGRGSYAARQEAQRRSQERRRRLTLWGSAAAVVLVLGTLALIALLGRQGPLPAAAATVDGISCDQLEHSTAHYHQHLRLVVEGKEYALPQGIGIYQDPNATTGSDRSCFHWLHTHATDGIIHVEAPQDAHYSLGQFFDIWGQPLSATQMMQYKADATHHLRAYVGGKLYPGNPRDIHLTPHASITLEYGPPFVPPQSFTFPAGD